MTARYMDYSGNLMADADIRMPGKDKHLQAPEDRTDSGLDSLREEDYNNMIKETETMSLHSQQQEYEPEPWKSYANEDGDTLLHLAIICEIIDVAVGAIQRSYRDTFYLNRQNKLLQTPLHLAIITDQYELAAKLLEAGCDPEMRDHAGNTALHIACKKGSLRGVGVIVQNCKSHLTPLLQYTNYDGHTCLHLASINGFLAIVEDLIRLGADVNAQEPSNGRTALHLAVDKQNVDLVFLLLKYNADVNRVTYQGHSACQLTWGRNNLQIQQHLLSLTEKNLQHLPIEEDDSSDSESEHSDDEYMYDDLCISACPKMP
ncbi:NF-kappa-B inhibitor alpha [Anomaloglossus baeobatrachus]|uniref:NF-kappa-B inhibitor alpha n=1 Tax=Anomaloglossus baeobatrachus TaxID=238106 RepID=UPI003F50619F